VTNLKILGKIKPATHKLNFDFVPEVHMTISAANITLKCTIEIQDSNIIVNCETSRWGNDVVPLVLNYVFDFVNAEIDLIIFSSGKAFSVHLDNIVWPDGTSQTFVIEAPNMSTLATACALSAQPDGGFRVEIKDIFNIVCTRPPLMLALRDLCAAIKFGNNTLANCGRAVEGMRKAMWGQDETNNAEERAAWEKLRNNLNITRTYVQSVTDASRQPRHGSSAYISPTAKEDALRKTWTIMDRLMIFYRDGEQKLPLSTYPEL